MSDYIIPGTALGARTGAAKKTSAFWNFHSSRQRQPNKNARKVAEFSVENELGMGQENG